MNHILAGSIINHNFVIHNIGYQLEIHEMENIRSHEVLSVNRKAKDTFFKTVYATEERQRALASFLLGVDGKKLPLPMCVPYCLEIRKTTLRSSVMTCFT